MEFKVVTELNTIDEQLKKLNQTFTVENGELDLNENVMWMNHPDAIEHGRNKMLQLKLAKEIGFSVPDTS